VPRVEILELVQNNGEAGTRQGTDESGQVPEVAIQEKIRGQRTFR
jgi:hypothetical protein